MDKEKVFEIVSKYIDYLQINQYEIVQVYLFGSYAKGKYNDNSDIDLAIVLKNIINKFEIQVQMLMLTTKVDTRIEPHPFDEKDFNVTDPLVNEILRYGIEFLHPN